MIGAGTVLISKHGVFSIVVSRRNVYRFVAVSIFSPSISCVRVIISLLKNIKKCYQLIITRSRSVLGLCTSYVQNLSVLN